jgi:hypothetical protein
MIPPLSIWKLEHPSLAWPGDDIPERHRAESLELIEPSAVAGRWKVPVVASSLSELRIVSYAFKSASRRAGISWRQSNARPCGKEQSLAQELERRKNVIGKLGHRAALRRRTKRNPAWVPQYPS